MTLRYTSGASILSLLACGLISVTPAQAQNADLLPPGESGVITVTGCLQRDGTKRYVLASPRAGTVASVSNGACDAAIDSRSLELDDADDRGINGSLVGRWIEISGRLEKETSTNPDNLRELSVRSFRLVTVVPPQRAVAAPVPVPQAEAPAPPPALTQPAAPPTAIQEPLPKTASPLALFGLLGLLSLTGVIGSRVYRSRAR